MNPTREMRQSPSGRRLGAFGFARLSLTAAATYTDSVPKQIPFDTIDDMSTGFGSLVTGGALNQPGAFRLTSTGIYLVQTTLLIDTAGTLLAAPIILGASDTIGGASVANGVLAAAASGNADVTSLAGIAGDIASLIENIGASGNIAKATCLILQVG